MDRLAFRLYLLFTPSMCRGDALATLENALVGGVDLVQWRAERDTDDLLRALEVCSAHDVPLIVNDDPAVAVRIGAAGAHVGQDDMDASAARAMLGPARWLGVSTHDVAQIRAAEAAGADYLGFGPCFPTATKGYATGQSPGAITAALAATELPVFAIGGITPENLPALLELGVRRIAVSSSILSTPDPGAAAAELARLLQSSSIASPNE